MASFFVNTLVELNDPRLPIFMDEATKNDGSQEKIGYKGYPSGFAAIERFDYNASNINATLGTAPMKVLFMTYAEVEFIKAEMDHRPGSPPLPESRRSDNRTMGRGSPRRLFRQPQSHIRRDTRTDTTSKTSGRFLL